MIQNGEIQNELLTKIDFIEKVIKERKELLKALLIEEKVTSYEEINDLKLFKCGAELAGQIEELEELKNDLKFHLKFIFKFKEI